MRKNLYKKRNSSFSGGDVFTGGSFTGQDFFGSSNKTTFHPRSKNRSLYIALLVATVVAGAFLWLLSRIVYGVHIDTWSRSFLIGFLFFLLTILLSLFIFIFSNITGTFERNFLSGGKAGSTVLILLIISLIVFGLGALFQWLYGLNISTGIAAPTSYIFVIDDSGSMTSNDPQQLRYQAISNVLADTDDNFPFMVYGFSDNVIRLREMLPKSEGMEDFRGTSNGGTAIRQALNTVISDYENGIWEGGNVPRVILLTDGSATDIDIFHSIHSVLKKYTAQHISISTVGLGYTDDKLMEEIADTTGGIYISVQDASLLNNALRTAARNAANRDLLSARHVRSFNWLYGFIRVLFLTILGALVGFAAAVAYGQSIPASLMIFSSLMKAFIGAIIVEFGTGALKIENTFPWFLYWLLIAMTITDKVTIYRTGGTRKKLGQS